MDSIQYFLVGCPALATAMVMMGEFEHPTEYLGDDGLYHIWNWDMMREYPYNHAYLEMSDDFRYLATEELPELLYQLGRPENLNMSIYGTNGSGIDCDSTYTNVPRTFKNFGFENPGHFVPFNADVAIEELNEGHPLFIQGTGHCWLCSSVMTQWIPVTVTNRYGAIISEGYAVYNLFYMNWGFDGAYNGFFYDGFFGYSLFHFSEYCEYIAPENMEVFEDPKQHVYDNVEILVGVRLPS